MKKFSFQTLFDNDVLPIAILSWVSAIRNVPSSEKRLSINKVNQSFKKIFSIQETDVPGVLLENVFSCIPWKHDPWEQFYRDLLKKIPKTSVDTPVLQFSYNDDQWDLQCFFFTTDQLHDGMYLLVKVHQNQLVKENAEMKLMLKKNQQLLESVLNTQNEMICRFTPDTILTYTNHAYAKNFNSIPEQLVGTSFLTFVPSEDHEFIRNHLRIIARDRESITYVHQVNNIDGTLAWQKWTDYPITNREGELIEFQSVGLDVTEQKIAEIETRRLSDLLTDAQKIAHFGAWALDVGTGITIWTDEIYQIHEVDKSFDHNKVNGLSFYHADDRPKLEQAINRVVSESEPFDLTLRFITAKQNQRWVRVSGRLSESIDGKPTVIGIIQDISNQKKIEQELQRARSEAIEASKAKSLFLANMSHEIRTPLNAVIGYSELINQTRLDPVQGEYLKNVLTAAKSLLDIINDILDLSKIEAGKLELEIVPSSILEILENTTDILSFQVEKKNLEFMLSIDPSIPALVMADPMRLKQILVNLLSNAVKFTEHGSIEIGAKLVTLNPKSVSVSFWVSDTGIGMTKDQRDKLFQAFSQGDNSTTRKFGGTGLGLVISHLLAMKMGSQIQVVSEIDKGSTFSFIITFNRMKDSCQGCFDFLQPLKQITTLILLGITHKKAEMIQGYSSLCNLVVVTVSTPEDIIPQILNSSQTPVVFLQSEQMIEALSEQLRPYTTSVICILESTQSCVINYRNLEIHQLKPPFKPTSFFEMLLSIDEKHSSETRLMETSTKQSIQIADVSSDYEVQIEKSELQTHEIRTLLIVEDIAMNLLLIKTLVRKKFPNATILEAINGNIAYEIAKEKIPDLILKDVQMPEMDGIQATQAIRDWEGKRNVKDKIPIYALTAGVLQEEHEKCMNAGMNGFLTKPVNAEELYKVLSAYLE